MKKKTTLLLLGLLLIFATACSDKTPNALVPVEAETETESIEVYQFEDIPLTLLDGTETSLYAYEGKTIVMNFWTSQCSYCSQMMPHLETLNKREDVVVLSINSGDSKQDVETYLKDKGYSFDVFLDEDGALSNSFAVRGVPTSFFISPNYELYLLQSGLVEEKGLEEIMSRIESFEKNKKGE